MVGGGQVKPAQQTGLPAGRKKKTRLCPNSGHPPSSSPGPAAIRPAGRDRTSGSVRRWSFARRNCATEKDTALNAATDSSRFGPARHIGPLCHVIRDKPAGPTAHRAQRSDDPRGLPRQPLAQRTAREWGILRHEPPAVRSLRAARVVSPPGGDARAEHAPRLRKEEFRRVQAPGAAPARSPCAPAIRVWPLRRRPPGRSSVPGLIAGNKLSLCINTSPGPDNAHRSLGAGGPRPTVR